MTSFLLQPIMTHQSQSCQHENLIAFNDRRSEVSLVTIANTSHHKGLARSLKWLVVGPVPAKAIRPTGIRQVSVLLEDVSRPVL